MALTKVTGQVINNTTDLVVGVTTVGGGLSATDGFFSGIVTAIGNASFSGNLTVGGVLTYEDVTNVDAVGLITARNGIVVGASLELQLSISVDGECNIFWNHDIVLLRQINHRNCNYHQMDH